MLAIACGLAHTYNKLSRSSSKYEDNDYDQILITRSNTISDNDLGFLPGDLEEKDVSVSSTVYGQHADNLCLEKNTILLLQNNRLILLWNEVLCESKQSVIYVDDPFQDPI